MKQLILFLFFGLSIQSYAQSDTLSAAQAKDLVGKRVIVKDIIAGARLFERADKTTFLINLNQPYPQTPLTIVLYDAIYRALNPKEGLENREIIVTGVVSIFNDKPQIVVEDVKNIKIK